LAQAILAQAAQIHFSALQSRLRSPGILLLFLGSSTGW